jgi:hypothetical protein
MGETKDISGLKAIVDFGFAVEKDFADVLAGGKFNLAALPEFLGLIPLVQPALAGFGDAVPELEDLSGQEAADLAAYVATKGVLPAHASKVLAKSLSVAAAAWDLIKTIQEPAV